MIVYEGICIISANQTSVANSNSFRLKSTLICWITAQKQAEWEKSQPTKDAIGYDEVPHEICQKIDGRRNGTILMDSISIEFDGQGTVIIVSDQAQSTPPSGEL